MQLYERACQKTNHAPFGMGTHVQRLLADCTAGPYPLLSYACSTCQIEAQSKYVLCLDDFAGLAQNKRPTLVPLSTRGLHTAQHSKAAPNPVMSNHAGMRLPMFRVTGLVGAVGHTNFT
jgi:hypothetical protein